MGDQEQIVETTEGQRMRHDRAKLHIFLKQSGDHQLAMVQAGATADLVIRDMKWRIRNRYYDEAREVDADA